MLRKWNWFQHRSGPGFWNAMNLMRFVTNTMKQLFSAGGIILLGVIAASAVDPIFINDNPVVSPPDNAPVIDATAWVNRAPFNVTTLSGFITVPFESRDTLFFPNPSI